MKRILLFFSALLWLSGLAPSKEPLKRSVARPYDESIEAATLPKAARACIAALREGVTRSDVEKQFRQNGGLSVLFQQRYYLVDVVVRKKVVMVELWFRPAKMPDDVYADEKRANEWATKHNWWGMGADDVVTGISKPFLSSVIYD